MTACSTIAGMLPVAIGLGAGAETRSPMGTAIVGGMMTSTVLTLIVVPVVYSLLDDVAGWLKTRLFRRPRLSILGSPSPAAAESKAAAVRLEDRPGEAPPITAAREAAP
jgi:HAE1 family hydrophobic/amphiphilic exporter-1